MTTWPDLNTDQQAWELAVAALGENASISETSARAQEIKDAIKRGQIMPLKTDFRSLLDCLQVEPETERERR